MEFETIVRQRRSIREFDPEHTITDDQLGKLFELVRLTPSAFNLQHWRFVVIRHPERKRALAKAAHDQPHVAAANAVVAVVAKLDAYKDAPRIFSQAPPEVQQNLLPTIQSTYAEHPERQRDDAFSNVSLAAMTLMLAAEDLGLASCAISGFDRPAVSELLGLDDQHVVVMLILLGKPTGRPGQQPYRWPIKQLVRLERLDGKPLE